MAEKLNILFVSLGCDKNLVDSEMMLGMLSDNGYGITNDESQADIVVVNTCSFIADAKEESINTLIEYGKMRSEGKLKALIATGCLSERYKEDIHREIPEVDALVGTASIDNIVNVLNDVLKGQAKDSFKPLDSPVVAGKKQVLTTGGYYAYLKIAEGCDKKCTYCAIPSFRGPYRSVPMEIVLEEATDLVNRGVKELILVAQETTVYGRDLYGKKSLPELLRKLCKIEDLKWIRLLYCYPEEIDDELIDVIKNEPKICHYLDLPIQHASDHILAKMGRRTNKAFLENLIYKLRKEIPDIALRTTLITGFPGESQEDFIETYNFVDEMEFDRLGVFTYSREEGTIAYDMPDQIDDEIKASRRDEIMELQAEIAFDKARSMIGRHLEVMIEGRLVEDGVLVARSYMDAPDVDGYVFIDSDRDYESGKLIRVIIKDSNEYDLIGEIEDELT